MSAVSALAAGSALEVLRRRFPDTTVEVDRGDDVRLRPAIGGFRTRREAREALPFTGSCYIAAARPDREGRFWLVPLERFRSADGYLASGPWNGWAAPRWDGD